MNWTLTFDGSEVQGTEGMDGHLRLLLSAACVEGWQDAQAASGYLKPAELVFTGASWQGDLALCMGALSGGVLSAPGAGPRKQVPLPWSARGPVQAEFTFRSGAVLCVSAVSVDCRCPDGAQFVESYAC
jgi:hypothetical protein